MLFWTSLQKCWLFPRAQVSVYKFSTAPPRYASVSQPELAPAPAERFCDAVKLIVSPALNSSGPPPSEANSIFLSERMSYLRQRSGEEAPPQTAVSSRKRFSAPLLRLQNIPECSAVTRCDGPITLTQTTRGQTRDDTMKAGYITE